MSTGLLAEVVYSYAILAACSLHKIDVIIRDNRDIGNLYVIVIYEYSVLYSVYIIIYNNVVYRVILEVQIM